MKDTMMLYGVTLGSRRTKRQKELFATQIGEAFAVLGYPVHSETGIKGPLKAENLVAGDLQRAKTVFIVPYDTPSRAIFPCNYYPLHPAFTVRSERADLVVHFLLASVLFVGSYILACAGLRDLPALLGAAAAVLAGGLWLLAGHTNRFNFNRGSAGVAVLVHLAETLPQREDLAFVFCDRAVSSYDGYKQLVGALPQAAACIVLDCVAAGANLIVAHGPLVTGRAETLCRALSARGVAQVADWCCTRQEAEQNLLGLFPTGILVCSGSTEQGELVVKNTRSAQDVVLDMPRLEALCGALAALADSIDERSPKP